MTFFFVSDWLVVVCQILSMVFGYLRSKQHNLDQAITTERVKVLKSSITTGSSATSSSQMFSGEFEESSSDDDDNDGFQMGYFDPPIKLGGKSRGFIIRKSKPLAAKDDLLLSGSVGGTSDLHGGSVAESTTWLNNNKDLDDEPRRAYSDNDLKSDLID